MDFKVGQKFKHYNGYIWTITEVTKTHVKIESTHEGQTAKDSMTKKDLQNVIELGYYTEVVE